MTRFELLIELNGVKQQLDTYNEEPISLTYNVADVSDISARNSSFSKTIRLPETRNNRYVFGDIADLGVNSSFNPNKKTKAWILVDTAVVFEGYLQLRKVYINKETEQGDYEVVIYADNDNFYKEIGDGFISDMDFSELDHIWNKTTIVQSFTASWNNGYYYPLIDYGQDWDLGEVNGWSTSFNTEVKIKDMFPSTNVRYIFDKIFSLAGYNYQSNFLTGDVFENLYIPFNKTGFVRDTATSSYGRFTVGMTQSLGYLNPVIKNTNRTMIVAGGGGQGGSGQTVAPSQFAVPLADNLRIPFNYEGAPYGDPDNLYSFNDYAPNNTTYKYVAPANFISEQFICNFDISFNYGIDYALNRRGNTTPLASICFRRSRNPLTGATVSGGTVVPIGGSQAPKRFKIEDIPTIKYSGSTTYSPGMGKNVKGQIATDELKDETATIYRKLYPGEELWVEITYAVPAASLRTQGGMYDATAPAYGGGTVPVWQMAVGTGILTWNATNQFFNSLSSIISPNELLTYNSVIPSNIKKKDFINSIIKMFNLYVEPSKEYPNTLVIEPRDDYYQSGAIKDWTRKLNTNIPVEEQILGETQNKKTTFKYKEDKDFYNTAYTTTTGGLSYGQYDYYIDNDFTTGEKKIEVIFSPTPLVAIRVPNSNNYSKLIIPKIVKDQLDQSQPFMDSNIRILTRKYNSTKLSWVYGDYQFNTSSGQYNAYVKLTSLGFGNALHPFKVGDYIKVAQSDGGALKPLLQGNFQIVEVINTRTIVIDLVFSTIGSGAAVAGTCYPMDGLLAVDDNSIWSFEGVKFRAYPYLGHLDNPQTPTYDINFGQTLGLYYPQSITTNNNLYNIYWENFINELSDRDSRIITAEFYLNPFDIADFKFNDNIYIRDQYYKVNKINNYDPTKEALVKVELIKSQYISVPRRLTGGVLYNPGNIGLSLTKGIRPMSAGGVLSTAGNTPLGSGTIIAGRGNIGTGLIVGRNNTISSEGAIAIGDNNTINPGADRSLALGDNNIINPSLELVPKFIFGSNNTHAGNGMVVGNGNTVQLGTNDIYLFGSDNFIETPITDSTDPGITQSATFSTSDPTSRVFIFGSGNTIGSDEYSNIKDVFIQGTGSSVKSSNVSVFGNNAILGTNSAGAYVIGNDITINTPDTCVINKPTTIITSTTLEVASKTTFTQAIRMADTVNDSIPVDGGFSSFLKLSDFPFQQGAFTGETIEGIADDALSSGQVGYLDGFGKWLIATSDNMFSAQEGGSQLGVIIHGASASDTTTILLRGFYSPGEYLRPETGFAIGQPLYIAPSSAGQGFITNLVPGSGNVVRIVGYLHSEDYPYTIRFSPDNTWIDLD